MFDQSNIISILAAKNIRVPKITCTFLILYTLYLFTVSLDSKLCLTIIPKICSTITSNVRKIEIAL